MPERIEADAAEVKSRVVAESMRDETVGGLMKGNGEDQRQDPDRDVVEGDIHECPDGFDEGAKVAWFG
jgi:hypothetical protein